MLRLRERKLHSTLTVLTVLPGKKCALSFHAGVQLVEEGIVDHSEDGDFLVDQPDRDANVREAVHEVGCAICVRVCVIVV